MNTFGPSCCIVLLIAGFTDRARVSELNFIVLEPGYLNTSKEQASSTKLKREKPHLGSASQNRLNACLGFPPLATCFPLFWCAQNTSLQPVFGGCLGHSDTLHVA